MSTRTIYRGASEYIEATVTADVTLDAQTVQLSPDGGATWLAATWLGSAGTTRTARTTSVVVASTQFATPGIYELLAKVTDTPEIPIVHCGGIQVR